MLAGIVALSFMIVSGMLLYNRLTIGPGKSSLAGAAGLGLALCFARYLLHRAATTMQLRLRDFCESLLVFMSISLLGVIASYSAAVDTLGFSDALLARADQALHMNWVAWYEVVAASPLLQKLGMVAYSTIYISPFLLLSAYAWQGRRAEAHRFLLTFWLAALLTLLLFPLFPAKGPLAHLWHGPIPYMPTSGLYQEQLIPALRARTLTEIDLHALRGLVCAPSFHTVCGVIYMAFGWRMPRLRRVLIPMNIAMLLATPVEGTHYFIDMILGAIVALSAIIQVDYFMDFIMRRLGAPAETAAAISADIA
ncbi:MAG: phosphatase PAP2 family protein [Sphingobium sp.]|nr:phosphatase PAP2 family protein [Sphingobium sp.]